ncbi:hypothetical protein OKC48_24720 [Methylorubrum extorquens]|uniref:hypothetical protein n=1 Tax=Methylorubrum extorquens TaxID=408 RepID=UPI002237AC8A|nr:hypothetical protein [Methylorubrum extorquens]UYW26422.1 hypothetical protein OKC48_24720 [Methylorubrum extorquens]
MDIDKGIALLRGFVTIDKNIEAQTMKVFLAVAHKGQCVAIDLERKLGLTNATVSRNITYWSDAIQKKTGEPGPGYIERRPNPRDRRYKLLRLTEDGQAFHRSLMA